MLELRQIKKDYPVAGEPVHALKGIDITFRKNEFVAILGPSGCGKTTMLNIIGGLDGYTSGDLIINGKSTKEFRDRDWDAYRNHSIGFVFQSYNLIPHQTVLSNVELALTLSGVSRAERRKRAAEALERVGLGNQLRKHPNELSGGQMQRVAIARAIVNNPDIILADEPTGALDTETGIQVMELLKEIASDRLVVMVTHNPDLAERYATRTITMLDGLVTGDSMPVSDDEKDALTREAKKASDGKKKSRKEKKPSMSFWTSFGLSLNNLFTKKGRTTLTSFAGSIGIIGIALIYAVSNGANTFINTVQEETLTAYPLSLESETIQLSTLIETFMGKKADNTHGDDAVYSKSMIYDIINTLNTIEKTKNDLAAFKSFLEKRMADENDESGLRDAVSGVQYSYDLNIQLYTQSVDGQILHSDISELMGKIIAKYSGVSTTDMGSLAASNPMMALTTSSSTTSSGSSVWQEMLPGKNGATISDVFEKQYDVLYGSWPNDYNELVLVVDGHNELSDLTLYALGLIPQEDIDSALKAMGEKKEIEYKKKSWSYEEICNLDFRIVLPGNLYSYDEKTGAVTDLRDTEAGTRFLYNNGIPVKIAGIIREKPDAVTSILTASIGYTSKLTDYYVREAAKCKLANLQKDSPDTDIFTGLPFSESITSMTEKEKADAFRENIKAMSEKDKADMYVDIMSIPTDAIMEAAVAQGMQGKTRAEIEAVMSQVVAAQMGVDAATVSGYLASMSDEEINDMFKKVVEEQVKAQYAAQVKASLAALTDAQLAAALEAAVGGYTDEQCAEYYENSTETSESTLTKNLVKLGCIDLDDPAVINLYASTFKNKDIIEDAIAEYNSTVDEIYEIKYTDYVGIMMSSITDILNAITYVLIAFVAISLIVSSIMIGVITLISVQERTKEIGILRAIGASKANVSSMFNAETVIIGFTSGLIGVLITYLLCIPINLVLHKLTDINNLSAHLPVVTAVILVGISVLLTLIAGIIPSRSAAKKDPVIALRTE